MWALQAWLFSKSQSGGRSERWRANWSVIFPKVTLGSAVQVARYRKDWTVRARSGEARLSPRAMRVF